MFMIKLHIILLSIDLKYTLLGNGTINKQKFYFILTKIIYLSEP